MFSRKLCSSFDTGLQVSYPMNREKSPDHMMNNKKTTPVDNVSSTTLDITKDNVSLCVMQV